MTHTVLSKWNSAHLHTPLSIPLPLPLFTPPPLPCFTWSAHIYINDIPVLYTKLLRCHVGEDQLTIKPKTKSSKVVFAQKYPPPSPNHCKRKFYLRFRDGNLSLWFIFLHKVLILLNKLTISVLGCHREVRMKSRDILFNFVKECHRLAAFQILWAISFSWGF